MKNIREEKEKQIAKEIIYFIDNERFLTELLKQYEKTCERYLDKHEKREMINNFIEFLATKKDTSQISKELYLRLYKVKSPIEIERAFNRLKKVYGLDKREQEIKRLENIILANKHRAMLEKELKRLEQQAKNQ